MGAVVLKEDRGQEAFRRHGVSTTLPAVRV